MAGLHQSLASLRIGGDSLDPDEVTEVLGCVSTREARKGHPFNEGGALSKTGTWQLDAEDSAPGDIESQIAELLGKLTQNLDDWAGLGAKYDIDIFCGLFMRESTEGFGVSSKIAKQLSDRDIRLEICLYAPTQSDA